MGFSLGRPPDEPQGLLYGIHPRHWPALLRWSRKPGRAPARPQKGGPLHFIAFLFGLVCLSGVYLDAFQTIILPRRPSGRLRLTRLFYLLTWRPWSAFTRRVKDKKLREQIFSIYGPASLLLLLAVWALFLIVGFAAFYFSMKTPFTDSAGLGNSHAPFRTDLYVSGTTLFTLGLGDIVPRSMLARAVVIAEAGTGLGFVALVIGYLPVLYQAFSRREVDIALLDARAGSPPTALEMLRRHTFDGGDAAIIDLLAEWERWSAEILETHISYPILCYYRSQHDNQNWLAAITAMLDTCALLIAVVRGPTSRQAQLTFAMARHALIDLGHVFHLEKKSQNWPQSGRSDRLGPNGFQQICDVLAGSGVRLCGDQAAAVRLHAIRSLYEPHACALADYLGMSLAGWVPEPNAKDQWVTINRLREQAEAVLAEGTTRTGNVDAALLDQQRLPTEEQHEH